MNQKTDEKKMIFICIFNYPTYIKLFYILLESLYIYGNLDSSTDIVIYTSSIFKNIIMKSHLYSNIIKFEINDNYNSIENGCFARLDLFNLDVTKDYKKILYLDTDIVIKGDINKIYDIINDDILYVLEEGNLNLPEIYWGRQLFSTEELNSYQDKSTFTSGILLFNNCPKIKKLFENINEDIEKRNDVVKFYDQPFIVYNAFKYNIFDNKILKLLAENNELSIHTNNIIHHFPGTPGLGASRKIIQMTKFLGELKKFSATKIINETKLFIMKNLMPIIKKCDEPLEGNIFMIHNTNNISNIYADKIYNICEILMNRKIVNVLEIGFNAGFSSLLMLLTNPNIKLTCVDINMHKYTYTCYEKIKEIFGDRINLIIGDSVSVLKTIDDKFDLIHIDGCHQIQIADKDVENSYKLSKHGTIIIMDDYDMWFLHDMWDIYVKAYNLKNLDISIHKTNYHDIKYVTY